MFEDFNSKVDLSRRTGLSDTEILNRLSKKDNDFAEKLNKSRGLNLNDRDILNKLSVKFSGKMPTVPSVPIKEDRTVTLPTQKEEPQKEKSFLRKTGDFFTSAEQNFGETIGGALATKSKDLGEARESQAGLDDLNIELGKQIIENKKQGKDTAKLEALYERNVGSKFDLGEIIPASTKSTKQIFGEGLAVASDIASFGKFGTTDKIRKADTLRKATLEGVKKFGTEGALISGAFGAAGALQEDKSLKEVGTQAIKSGITGGLISGLIGGASSKKDFLAPETSEIFKQKAVELYKKGLQATKEKFKEKTEKIIPELLKENVWGTMKGIIKKADDGIELAKNEYSKLGELQGIVETDGLIKKIDESISKMLRPDGTPFSTKNSSYKQLLSLKDDIIAMKDKVWIAGKDVSTNTTKQQQLRELAQIYGSELYDTRKAMKTINDSKTLSMIKKVDGAIRNVLNKNNPEYSKINKIYHLNTELKDILMETAKRKEGNKVLGLISAVAGTGGFGIGTIAGGPLSGVLTGGALIGLTKVLNSTWWNTMQAVRKNKIADKILTNSKKDINEIVLNLSRKGETYLKELFKDDKED